VRAKFMTSAKIGKGQGHSSCDLCSGQRRELRVVARLVLKYPRVHKVLFSLSTLQKSSWIGNRSHKNVTKCLSEVSFPFHS